MHAYSMNPPDLFHRHHHGINRIATSHSNLSTEAHSAVACILIGLLSFGFTMVEGGHASPFTLHSIKKEGRFGSQIH